MTRASRACLNRDYSQPEFSVLFTFNKIKVMSHNKLRLSLVNLQSASVREYVVPIKEDIALIRKNNIKLLTAEFDRRVGKGLIDPEDNMYTTKAFAAMSLRARFVTVQK